MSDFIINAPVRALPSFGRVRSITLRVGAAMRMVAEAWANRPRFQTYHEMVAEYEPESRIARKAQKAQPFSDTPRLHLPGWY